MADHGEVEYATAAGNDYQEHEGTYEAFLHLTLVGILNVITIVIGLTVGGVMGHWIAEGILIVLAAISLLVNLMRGTTMLSKVVTAIALLSLAVYGLG
ncbi:MAG: aa3-type cytochrome c oxidase subunit IV [Xanthobacteraceae bacterium]